MIPECSGRRAHYVGFCLTSEAWPSLLSLRQQAIELGVQPIETVMDCRKLILIVLNHEEAGDGRGEYADPTGIQPSDRPYGFTTKYFWNAPMRG